jgi:hypothetical protein
VTLSDMQRFLMSLGLVILVTAVTWPIRSLIGLGRAPEDFLFQCASPTLRGRAGLAPVEDDNLNEASDLHSAPCSLL